MKSKSRAAFTLIELMLAIAVALLILLVAIPSISGLSEDKELQKSFERFDELTKKAQEKAVTEQRTYVLVWGAGVVSLQPDQPNAEELQSGGGGAGEDMQLSSDEVLQLQRPAALLPAANVPAEWPFWRSGTCEPVLVHYQGPSGWWTAQYNALTGRGEIIDQGK